MFYMKDLENITCTFQSMQRLQGQKTLIATGGFAEKGQVSTVVGKRSEKTKGTEIIITRFTNKYKVL